MAGSLIRNTLAQPLPTVSEGSGIYLWDTEGNQYIDGSSGACVACLGHSDPAVIGAISEQAQKVTYVHRGAFTNYPAEEVANLLAELTGMQSVWLVNSGSEAVEAALHFALQYWQEVGQPQRSQFLSSQHGYHGTTMGALSLSGHARRVHADPILHQFHRLPAPWPFRYRGSRSESEYTAALLAEARTTIAACGEQLAAVVIEPVGGATGGAVVPPAGYLAGLQHLCREAGALIILDEVMTGLWRTGKRLAADHWGLEPDIVALGKGMGAGYAPIAATLTNSMVIDAIRDGSGVIKHGHTYAGNPLGSATGLAVLRRLAELDLDQRVPLLGKKLLDGLKRLEDRHSIVAEARGLGLLTALELVDSTNGEEEPGRLSALVTTAAMREGLLVYPATGGMNDAIMIAPPFIITEDEIDDLVARLDRSLASVV